MRWANAVGASNVEKVDAISGVRNWAETQERLVSGWAERQLSLPGYGNYAGVKNVQHHIEKQGIHRGH